MGACAQCGTVGKPTDKFCNVCGTPLAQAAPPQAPAAAPAPPAYAPPPGYGAPPGYPPQQGYASPAPARCQMGHEIAPGASYCPQGHPIALDQMQFAADPYGGQGGAAPGGYAPPPNPQAYGAPPQPPYAPPPQQAQPAYGAPAPAPSAPQGYTPPPGAYAPVPSPGFGGQQGYAPAPAQPGYPAPAPAPVASPMAATAQPQYADPSRDKPQRVLRGFLVAYGTNASGDFWALTAGRHVLGRLGAGDGVDISLQDPTISSRHAALVVDGGTGAITLEDTGSTNGTFVNDEHIGFNGRRDLRDGDRLRFGGYTTIVKIIGRI